MEINNSASLTKKFQTRKTVEDILFTGNLIIDYINPLYKGNFSVFSGNSSMGQRNCLINSSTNFLASPADFNENHFLIYVTYSKKDALILKEKLAKNLEAQEKELIESSKNTEIEEFDLKEIENLKHKYKDNKEANKIKLNKKFCIFTLNDKHANSEYYYLPKIALNFTQSIKDSSEEIFGNKNKLNILYCFDDVSIFALKEKKLYDTSRLYQVNSMIYLILSLLKIRVLTISLLTYTRNVEIGINIVFLQ